jgi:hypothetical protein
MISQEWMGHLGINGAWQTFLRNDPLLTAPPSLSSSFSLPLAVRCGATGPHPSERSHEPRSNAAGAWPARPGGQSARVLAPSANEEL